MREGIRESFRRHPDPSVIVRNELRGLRMHFVTVKDLGNSLTFLRGKRRHIDQRFHSLVICSRNHSAGVRVTRCNHGALRPGDCPVQRDDVVAEGGEWERRGNNLESFFAEKKNYFLPTRSIRPSAMGNNYRADFSKGHLSILDSRYANILIQPAIARPISSGESSWTK